MTRQTPGPGIRAVDFASRPTVIKRATRLANGSTCLWDIASHAA